MGYGLDRNVPIEETIADAGEPVKIKWYGDSYLDIPVRVMGG